MTTTPLNRTLRIPSRFSCAALVAFAVMLLSFAQLHGQSFKALSIPRGSPTSNAPASLPKTVAEMDSAIAGIETRLTDVRAKVSATNTDKTTAARDVAARPEELAERQQLLHQWVSALDRQARNLRNYKEIHRLNEQRVAEQDAWRGFAQPPTVALAERLADMVSAQRLELRNAEMMLPIYEGDISRNAARLIESQKQLRLAEDQAADARVRDSRNQQPLQLAQLRTQANEASVEAAELGRLVTSQQLEGKRRYVEFLERKLSSARAQARITRADLDGVLAQINERRAALQKELDGAVAADQGLQASHALAVGRVPAVPNGNPAEPQLVAEIEAARFETSTLKVESLRSFLQLTDYARTIWQDRVWAAEPRSLRQLRDKEQHHQQRLERLREWKGLMEQSLSAMGDQILRQTVRSEDARLPIAEREAAKQVRTSLQERALIELRTVGALAFTQDLAARLHTDISAQVAQISMWAKMASFFEGADAFLHRIWNTELYIAEDSVIAGGQKVSVPRIITVGKVAIALSIFGFGLLLARWANRLAGLASSRWLSKKNAAGVPTKAFAAVVVLISLLVAMASVRIPWTVFAFMGGALAIGVGFGAQTLINNFISGIILLCERSIRVGDLVEVDNQRGKIMRVGFRNSLIARSDGSEVLVPNSQFLEKKVVNWTLSNDKVRYQVAVGVAYDAPRSKAAELIAQAAAEHAQVSKEPAPEVLLDNFGDHALLFTLEIWIRLSPDVNGGKVRSELRHRIMELFDEAKISMPFPHRDIHLNTNSPLEIKVVDPRVTNSG
ncbi:MAG: putative Mechanosensitive ion channel family protein [Verrucomicrobiales bacterium]|nr:putative Mechanosensitive ion channel family protein [Verrucomicrobiales bacterium]